MAKFQKDIKLPSPTPPLVLGFLLCAYGIFALGEFVMFEIKAIHTKATVESTRQERLSGRRGSIAVYRPVLDFADPKTGEAIVAVSTNAASGFDFSKGREVDIEFDPVDPSHTARVDSGVAMLDVALSASGLFGLGLGLSRLIQRRRLKRSAQF